jgi:hypothetical protein
MNLDNTVQPINMNSGKIEEIANQTSSIPQSFSNLTNQINTRSENINSEIKKNTLSLIK